MFRLFQHVIYRIYSMINVKTVLNKATHGIPV